MGAFEDDFGPRKKVPAAMNKYTPPGTTVAGIIVADPEVRAVRDFYTKEIKTFPDGNPMKQWVFLIQTDQRDPADPDDDGVRAVYVKGRNKPRLRECAAMLKLSVEDRVIRRGGWLSDTYVREEGEEKIHAYDYRPPPPGQPEPVLAGSPITAARVDHQGSLRAVAERAGATRNPNDEPPF